MLSKNEILGIDDLPVLEVPTPRWGEGTSVFIRTLTAAEREALGEFNTGENGTPRGNFLGRFAALVLCDHRGNRLFTDADADALGGKNADVLLSVVEAAQKHNSMLADSREAIEKNSVASQD